jgi:hypothetical protein
VEGEVTVAASQRVDAADLVARADLPGPVHALGAAAALGIPRAELSRHMVALVGQAVAEGQVIARSSSLFGLFSATVEAPVGGIVESVSATTGQVLIRAAPAPIELNAYVSGTVVEVFPSVGVTIEAEVALAQGIFGFGGEASGDLVRACAGPGELLDEGHLSSEHRDRVVLGGGRITRGALQRLRELGVRAVVTGSARGADLIATVGHQLNPAATGDEETGFTLVLTEGFGELEMARRTFELLTALEGRRVSASGATQVRAGVIRPEIVGPPLDAPAVDRAVGAELGALVRVVRGERFGAVGTVVGAPDEPRELGSGAVATVFEVELEDGTSAVVPRANVESIG